MRRAAVIGAVCACALAWAAPGTAGGPKASARVAALQVALRAHGLYAAGIDGLQGPATTGGLLRFQRRHGLPATGNVGTRTRRALGKLGTPVLGQRELWVGLVGWDVSSLEFRLRRLGYKPGTVDGRFAPATERALRKFQHDSGLRPDGILGRYTLRALAHASRPRRAASVPAVHVVAAGESFFSISQRYHVSPWILARINDLRLTGVIVPGQRLKLPRGARLDPTVFAPRGSVSAEIDHWSRIYGVDPKLARALAWMESGFQQDVVSSVGAIGVMQLLPQTWDWIDVVLIGHATPRTASGNVRAGVRYLRWQLDQFGGDVSLALAGYYQGARAVRERGLFEDTKQYVSVILQLYGTV